MITLMMITLMMITLMMITLMMITLMRITSQTHPRFITSETHQPAYSYPESVP